MTGRDFCAQVVVFPKTCAPRPFRPFEPRAWRVMTSEGVPGNLRAANALRARRPTVGSGASSSVPVALAAWRSGSPDSMGGRAPIAAEWSCTVMCV